MRLLPAATAAALTAVIVTLSGCESASSTTDAEPGPATSDSTAAESSASAGETAPHATGSDRVSDEHVTPAANPAQPASLAARLRGHSFKSVSMVGRDFLKNSAVIVTFTDEGTISLGADCNNLFGPVDITEGRIASSTLASTMMACHDAAMRQDAYLAELIEGGMDASLVGDRLTLISGDAVIEMIQHDKSGEPYGAEVGDLEEPTPGEDEIPAYPGD